MKTKALITVDNISQEQTELFIDDLYNVLRKHGVSSDITYGLTLLPSVDGQYFLPQFNTNVDVAVSYDTTQNVLYLNNIQNYNRKVVDEDTEPKVIVSFNIGDKTLTFNGKSNQDCFTQVILEAFDLVVVRCSDDGSATENKDVIRVKVEYRPELVSNMLVLKRG